MVEVDQHGSVCSVCVSCPCWLAGTKVRQAADHCSLANHASLTHLLAGWTELIFLSLFLFVPLSLSLSLHSFLYPILPSVLLPPSIPHSRSLS